MHSLGATRLVVVGVPPLGCMPLVKTLGNVNTCVESYNKVAFSFNNKIKVKLAILRKTVGIKNTYVDCFRIIQNAIKTPHRFGQYNQICLSLSTCLNDAKVYLTC